jgi:hypothetical protein
MRRRVGAGLVVALAAGLAPAGADLPGRGITVAVLDVGFRGWRGDVGRTLPLATFGRSFRDDGDLEARPSRHGVRCAAVVHAVAPGSRVLLANWEPDRPESFLAALGWAKAAGAGVVTCSVVMPAWGDGEGGGAVHAEAARLIGEGTRGGDLVAVACAGNLTGRTWSGVARAGPGGWHAWSGSTIDAAVTPFGTGPVGVEVCGPSASQIEVVVIDDGGADVARAAGEPGLVARWRPRPGTNYRLRVRAAGRFHVAVLGGWLEHADSVGRVPFPGDGPAWLAVGATEGGRPAAYGGCSAGKPELWAPVPFALAGGEGPLTGTSAAAPQIAGRAAAWWSSHPGAPAADVKAVLRRASGS